MKARWSLLLTWLLTFPAIAALADTRIDVVNAPTPLWEERVEVEIGRANQFLCRSFDDLPGFVRIFKSSHGPEYDLSIGMIFIHQDYLPVHLYHEYGHKILDHYLQSRSAVLSYYQLRQRLGGQPLEHALDELELNLNSDQEDLAWLRRQRLYRLAGNLNRWIQNHETLLFEASSVVHLEYQLAPSFQQIQAQSKSAGLLQLLAPYHELFADTLAVFLTGRWDSIYMSSTALSGHIYRIGFIDQAAMDAGAQVLSYRAFMHYLTLDLYQFSEQEKSSVYSQFAPVRSYIRYLYEQQFEYRSDLLLRYLAEAIQQQMEQRLSSRQGVGLSLKEMNKGLISSLQERLGKAEVHRADNCRSGSSAIGRIR